MVTIRQCQIQIYNLITSQMMNTEELITFIHALISHPLVSDRSGLNTLHLLIVNWPVTLNNRRLLPIETNMLQRTEDCLQVLCEHGVNINARTRGPGQQTALHLAVSYRALSAVGILGSRGARINNTDHAGMTPLHIAAGILHTEITSCLIQLGADVNKSVEHSGDTSLHLAVQAASKTFSKMALQSGLNCIKELLERGALPNAVNSEGHTPLHQACYGGREEVVDLLFKHGGDINKLTSTGESGLFFFLSKTTNLQNTALLAKLLCLTNPLRLVTSQGCLPYVLMLPWYSEQKDKLMFLSQQPRDLLEICKIHFLLNYKDSCKPFFKETLPEKLYNFVFHHWQCPSDLEFNIPEVSFTLIPILPN